MYLTLKVRGRSSSHTSTAVMYEEVGVVTGVKGSQDIQLTANEAYGPLHMNRHAHGQGKLCIEQLYSCMYVLFYIVHQLGLTEYCLTCETMSII